MLRVDLGGLARGPLDVEGSIEPGDPLVADLDVQLTGPVRVDGRVNDAGEGQYYWRGRLRASAEVACRRCLKAVAVAVDTKLDVVFTENQDAEDPSEYVIPVGSGVLDLRDAVREEFILALPEYVVCREDCRGLCASCGTDLNEGTCSCKPSVDPRWAVLESLRSKPDG